MTDTVFNVKLLTPTARLPEAGSEAAAGCDLFADFWDTDGKPRRLRAGGLRDTDTLVPEKDWISGTTEKDLFIKLPPFARVIIPTGIAAEISANVYAHLAPRSGLAIKAGCHVMAGIVDADYRNEWGVVICNLDPFEPMKITHGMRIAQVVLECVSLKRPTVVNSLSNTVRGLGGFGSTGL